MQSKILVFLTVGLTALVVLSGVVCELSWLTKENSPDFLRATVGLSSTTVGNLNPSARNPGVELLCSGLFDVPGGYCSYFALGVPVTNFTVTIINSTDSMENFVGEK